MKRIFLITAVLLTGYFAIAQESPEAWLKKSPALPKDSCSISKQAMEAFVSQVGILLEQLDDAISIKMKEEDKQSHASSEIAKENAAKQMAQYGMSEEEISKIKSGKKMSKEEKDAMANKVMMQQTNMSMDELKKLSTMSDAGKQAYMEAISTEAMANAQANPKQQQPGSANGQNMYKLIQEQQTLQNKITSNGSIVANSYAEIENDPSRKVMLDKIDKWHQELMSMTGVDYGQGEKMDTLAGKIEAEQIKYCNTFTPKYRAALRRHLAFTKSSMPDYMQLAKVTDEVMKAQTGAPAPAAGFDIMCLHAIREYLVKLQDAYKYKLYYPEQ